MLPNQANRKAKQAKCNRKYVHQPDCRQARSEATVSLQKRPYQITSEPTENGCQQATHYGDKDCADQSHGFLFCQIVTHADVEVHVTLVLDS